MTADDLIKVIGAISGAAAVVGLPTYLKTRKPKVTSDSVAKMIMAERDRLQTRLDNMEAQHDKELRDVQDRAAAALATAQTQAAAALAAAETQIAQLRTEMDGLYRRIYTPPGPLPGR